MIPVFRFDGEVFEPQPETFFILPAGQGDNWDWEAMLALNGWEPSRLSIGQQITCLFDVKLHQHEDGRYLFDLSDTYGGLTIVVCGNAITMLQFLKDFILPLNQLNSTQALIELIERLYETVLDPELGWESVQAEARRKSRITKRFNKGA